jgi:O-antigen/teichoic acid export membrane protein
MSSLRTVKNAFANLCRGGASALVALLLPPFLTKILSKDSYNTWLLILQLSTYVSFLDFGIQMGVGRFVAHYTELGDTKKRSGVVSSAFALLSGLGMIGMVGIATLAWQLPNLFKDMPFALHQEAQISLLLVGGSLAIGLPFSAFSGVFVGLHRYDIPAWVIGVTKLFGGIAVVLIANASHSLVAMAIVMATANICAGIGLFLAQKILTKDILFSIRLVSKKLAVEILDYCFGLSIWTIGCILVSGLDTAIIGYFKYDSLIYYNLAATIASLVVGVQGSIIAVIMPTAATMGARQDREKLGKFLVDSTRYGAIIIIITSLPILLFSKWIVTLWVGAEYADHVVPLLDLLVIGNSIRYLGGAYAIIVAAVGEQKLIIMSPLIEGAVNLVVSVLLVSYIGVIGVAIGTIVGGFISVGTHFMYNLPRTKSILVEKGRSLWEVIYKPLIITIPAVAVMVYTKSVNIEITDVFSISISFLSFAITVIMLLYFEISQVEREQMFATIEKKLIGKN